MTIGILKEASGEDRVALLPEHIKTLATLKVKTLVEKGAGEGAFFSDDQYSEAGAIVTSSSDIINASDILVSIGRPDKEKLDGAKGSKIFIGTFSPLTEPGFILSYLKGGYTLLSLDLIPRISRAQSMDVLSSMATVAGYRSVLDAAMNLPRFFPMFMSAAGTIKPARILILGAGVAGLQAIATARKLGAVVEVFDVRSAVKEEVRSLGGKFIEVEGATEDSAAGGYAVEQTEEFKARQAEMIHDHAVKSNAIICTAQIPGRIAPLLIHKATVDGMMAGSVIVDLAASSGGNCEVTENNKTIVYNNVKVIGKSDYPSSMASDASKMYGTNLVNFLKLLINEDGSLNLDFNDEIIAGTCLTSNGELINERVKILLNTK